MTDEQKAAFEQLRALARPGRFGVMADAEGFPAIPGRYGQIEWFDEEGFLTAYTAGSAIRRGKLLALPGIVRHQIGDAEVRVRFPAAQLAEVARAIAARRRRPPAIPPPGDVARAGLHRARERASAARIAPGSAPRIASGATG